MNKSDRRCCADCKVPEGRYHEPGCYKEKCPFCFGQMVSCNCSYEQLGLVDKKKYPETGGLDPEIYKNGLSDELRERYEEILMEVGLIPYIFYPSVCNRCGELSPEMFMRPDEEWNKYVSPNGERFLCKDCYDLIKQWIDGEGTEIPYQPRETCYEFDRGIVMSRKSIENLEKALEGGEKIKVVYENHDYAKEDPRTLWLWEGEWLIVSYMGDKGKYWELDLEIGCREEALEFLYRDIIKRDV